MTNEYNLSILEALFKDHLVAEKISHVSAKNYRSDIKHYLSWFYVYVKPYVSYNEDGSMMYSYLDLFIEHSAQHLIEEFKRYLLESKIPLKTINRRLSAIRRFYSFCVKRGYFEHNISERVLNVVKASPHKERPYIQHPVSQNKNFEKYISDNLNIEKQEQILKDYKEFLELWN